MCGKRRKLPWRFRGGREGPYCYNSGGHGGGKKAVWRHNDAMCLTHGYLAYARARANISHHARLRCENATITWVKKITNKKPRFISIHQGGKHEEGNGHVKCLGWSRRKTNKRSFLFGSRRSGRPRGFLPYKLNLLHLKNKRTTTAVTFRVLRYP